MRPPVAASRPSTKSPSTASGMVASWRPGGSRTTWAGWSSSGCADPLLVPPSPPGGPAKSQERRIGESAAEKYEWSLLSLCTSMPNAQCGGALDASLVVLARRAPPSQRPAVGPICVACGARDADGGCQYRASGCSPGHDDQYGGYRLARCPRPALSGDDGLYPQTHRRWLGRRTGAGQTR